MGTHLLNCQSLIPFKPGFVQNGSRILKNAQFKKRNLSIIFPSRINAMAIDPTAIAIECSRRFTPGEILFSIDLPLRVDLSVAEADTPFNSKLLRKALVSHAIGMMRWLTGFSEKIEVKVEGKEYPHCGLGSSGRLIAAICSGINEMLGKPVNPDVLQTLLAQNHGEEIISNDELLLPVQCIGGSASSGLNRGGMQIIAGKSRLIASKDMPENLKIVFAYPSGIPFIDSKTAMQRELEHINEFYKIGEKFKHQIAYRVLHELIPSMNAGEWDAVGEIIEWYRYDLGSNEACSFSHPQMIMWANSLRKAKKSLRIHICGISSVGPGLYAITKDPHSSEEFFKELGLRTMTTNFYNNTYEVLDHDAC